MFVGGCVCERANLENSFGKFQQALLGARRLDQVTSENVFTILRAAKAMK
jgi:hypothetical protein